MQRRAPPFSRATIELCFFCASCGGNLHSSLGTVLIRVIFSLISGNSPRECFCLCGLSNAARDGPGTVDARASADHPSEPQRWRAPTDKSLVLPLARWGHLSGLAPRIAVAPTFWAGSPQSRHPAKKFRGSKIYWRRDPSESAEDVQALVTPHKRIDFYG